MTVIGYADSIEGLVRLLAKRRYDLGIASLNIDTIAGLADGHTAKIECRTKGLGDISLHALLATYVLRLAIIEDEAALPAQTIEMLHTSRGRPMVRNVAPVDEMAA